MGIAVIGGDVTPKKVVIPNIQTTSTTVSNTKVARTVIVPRGVYSVNLVRTGGPLGGSSVGYATSYLNNTSIVAYDATTSRPLSFYNGTLNAIEPTNQSLYILKDSYLQINISASPTAGNISFDVVLEPTQSYFNIDFAFTPAGGTTTGTTSSADVGVGMIAMGYDYDSDSPLIITSGTGTTTGRNQRYTSSFALWRKNASTGAWSKKTFTTSSATGYTWYQANGIVVSNSNTGTSNGAGFFIKNNILHNVIQEGWMTDDATSYRWGWIKADVSVASGSNIPFSPGSTNTAFGQPSGDIASGTGNQMFYWHDLINKKVLYNGARSVNYNGSYGTYPWLHKWGQYDINTGAIDYQIDNGTVDPRLAGSSIEGQSYMTPNIANGNSYGISANGSSSYLTYYDRSGNKTGVGNVTIYRSNSPNQGTSLQPLTTSNQCLFLDNNEFVMQNYISSDLLTNRNMLYDTSTFSRLYPVSSSVSAGTSNTQVMITPNKVYTLESAHTIVANSDASGPYYNTIVQLLSAPVNNVTKNIIVNKHGGTPNASYNSNTGSNPIGTW